GYSVSGQLAFDAMGRVAQQGQVTFDSGAAATFVPGTPLNPTFFTYDVLGRTLTTAEPNSQATSTGGLAITSVGYDFGMPAGDSFIRFRKMVTDANGNVHAVFRDMMDHIVAIKKHNTKENGNIT